MPTQNSWNNKISTGPAITLNSGTNAINISSDASATTVNVATGGAVKTVSLGSTNGASVTTVDCGTGGANFGATANAHTTTVGSTNSTSATTLQSGSGALAVTATGGALTINSGTGTLEISSDASATTVNIATGGAAKVVTLGSTNGASSLALKCGTADFSLASATGTLMSVLDTGEATMPLQPSFCGVLSANVLNVSGDGTFYTIIANTERYDRNGDYNNTNGIFTAPVTGIYFLAFKAAIFGCTICTEFDTFLTTSNFDYSSINQRAASSLGWSSNAAYSCDMDAGDTAYCRILAAGEAAKTDDLYGTNSGDGTFFVGYLLG